MDSKHFRNTWWQMLCMLMIFLLLAACDGSNDPAGDDMAGGENHNGAADTAGTEGEGLDNWLQEVNASEGEILQIGQRLGYGLGYLLYYGDVETLGVDNLIYNALEAHRRRDTGEAASPGDENLIELAEGLVYNPEVELTEQVGQSEEVRAAIMERVVDNQRDLSPQEALDSGNVVGIVALPAPESIGEKFLVYTQDSPDAELEFLGVVIAVDASSQSVDSQEVYSFQGWEELPWLGDATGPFWDDLPAGVSDDPANTDEGRPGVLLLSEEMFTEINDRSS